MTNSLLSRTKLGDGYLNTIAPTASTLGGFMSYQLASELPAGRTRARPARHLAVISLSLPLALTAEVCLSATRPLAYK